MLDHCPTLHLTAESKKIDLKLGSVNARKHSGPNHALLAMTGLVISLVPFLREILI